MDKILLQLNIERCRELYDTGILFNGGKNPFIQSVFLELLIRLRHLDHSFNGKQGNSLVKDIRDAGAHPWLHREIDNTNIFVDFGRNFQGNWKYEDGILKKQDDNCDVVFQYGDLAISVKDILKLIEEFEIKIGSYAN